MIAFRVRLNADPGVMAGLPGEHVVSIFAGSAARDPRHRAADEQPLRLHVGGLRKASDRSYDHLCWLERSLKLGDSITIDVVDVAEADVPTPRVTKSADVIEDGERKQLDYLIKKYGIPSAP
jgi:hypothetical protein